ncbi:asparaginase [Odoribacter lunatus]|uniref:asparaginase n=1 Tax=Odoribacter lunatus TaxID=2941335 RepID=UPI0020421976|nr:asparaginase [Odoribacter lunatus]
MEKSVLIIYTGGTIGMINNPETGALSPFNFEQIVQEVPEIKEFGFTIDSYTLPEIIDSSDVRTCLWKELCQIIIKHYDDYCGFVILHGTDTMAYSASALSFMLSNLTKPVVFTGSQLPIGTIRTDGRENLIAALEIAAAYNNDKAIVPEVCILFGDKLFRGNRTTKINSESFDAFQSTNYPPLAEIGIHIHYNYDAIDYSPRMAPVSAFCEMDTHIVILKLFPGIRPEVMEAILRIPNLKGVVLESYGAGNAPSNAQFLTFIQEAIQKGIIIYNVTQCQGGAVEMGRYETSRNLLNIGVSSGYDITTEAAVCKMMYLLGQGKDANEIKKRLNSPLKGEITINRVGF